jgi:hypothetical protein
VDRPQDGDADGSARCDLGAYEAFDLEVRTLDDDGPGSLRQAIANAQINPGDDTVSFAPGLTGRVELASTLPVISGTLRIEGPGADQLTVDANDLGSVLRFRVPDPSTDISQPVVSGLTLTGGLADEGGGILAREGVLLRVVECSIEGNHANLRGGGIAALAGSVIVERSLLTANSVGEQGTNAGDGGAVYSPLGSIALFHSTVSSNIAWGRGGGLWSGSVGGGLYNATVVDNSASVAGGGLYQDGPAFQAMNSILAGNLGGDCNQTLESSSEYNLDGDGSCVVGNPGDLPATEPMLLPLAFNGGPTRTHSMLPTSPPVDAGQDVFGQCLEPDQRGTARPIDGDGDRISRCDLGALELTATPFFFDGFETGDTTRWDDTTR